MPRGPGAVAWLTDIRAFLQLDAQSGHAANTGWQQILSQAYPEWADEPLEQMLSFLVQRVKENRSGCQHLAPTQVIEFWAGSGNLTCEHVKLGLTCSRFDTVYSLQHDCTTSTGLRLWLEELCRTADSSLTWMGTTCSSFVPLCVSQSKRRRENGFRGDETRPFVQSGNEQMCVASLVFFLSWLMGNSPMLEQPMSSVMPKLQPLALVLQFTGAARTVTWLGHFGGDSPKPLQLWHSNAAYQELGRRRPHGAHAASLGFLTTRKGRKFSGRPILLKQSQEYPSAFGAAVATVTFAVLEQATRTV